MPVRHASHIGKRAENNQHLALADTIRRTPMANVKNNRGGERFESSAPHGPIAPAPCLSRHPQSHSKGIPCAVAPKGCSSAKLFAGRQGLPCRTSPLFGPRRLEAPRLRHACIIQTVGGRRHDPQTCSPVHEFLVLFAPAELGWDERFGPGPRPDVGPAPRCPPSWPCSMTIRATEEKGVRDVNLTTTFIVELVRSSETKQ
jgi:hypothetical protein